MKFLSECFGFFGKVGDSRSSDSSCNGLLLGCTVGQRPIVRPRPSALVLNGLSNSDCFQDFPPPSPPIACPKREGLIEHPQRDSFQQERDELELYKKELREQQRELREQEVAACEAVRVCS